MRRSIALLALILIASLTGGAGDAASCNTTWTKGGYKSYRQVESEVRSQHGDVKILRVMLCGEGEGAYFQVVVLNPGGKVQNVRVAAR